MSHLGAKIYGLGLSRLLDSEFCSFGGISLSHPRKNECFYYYWKLTLWDNNSLNIFCIATPHSWCSMLFLFFVSSCLWAPNTAHSGRHLHYLCLGLPLNTYVVSLCIYLRPNTLNFDKFITHYIYLYINTLH